MPSRPAPSAEETEYMMLQEQHAAKERRVMDKVHELCHKRTTYPEAIMQMFMEKKAIRLDKLTKKIEKAEQASDWEGRKRVMEEKAKFIIDMAAEFKKIDEETKATQKVADQLVSHSSLTQRSLNDPATMPILPEHRIRMTAAEFPFLAQ